MSNDVNVVTVIGNLTKDVELKYTKDGKALAKLGIAVNDDYKDVKKVYFFGVTVFGASAENCSKFLSKGKKVCVTGKLTQNTWEAQDGSKRSNVEISASKVQFLSPVSNATQTGNNVPQGATQGDKDDFYNMPEEDF